MRTIALTWDEFHGVEFLVAAVQRIEDRALYGLLRVGSDCNSDAVKIEPDGVKFYLAEEEE